jgi:hypothetical protein
VGRSKRYMFKEMNRYLYGLGSLLPVSFYLGYKKGDFEGRVEVSARIMVSQGDKEGRRIINDACDADEKTLRVYKKRNPPTISRYNGAFDIMEKYPLKWYNVRHW